eukprot:175074_1
MDFVPSTTATMWSCPRCGLRNYNDVITCRACYKLHHNKDGKSVNEYINQLQNKLNDQTTEINRLTELNISLTNSFENYKHNTETKIQTLTNVIDTQRDEIENDSDKYNNVKMLLGCSIDKLIPECLNSQQQLAYTRLFSGYIRQYNKNIPTNAIELISHFYPLFLSNHICDFINDDNDIAVLEQAISANEDSSFGDKLFDDDSEFDGFNRKQIIQQLKDERHQRKDSIHNLHNNMFQKMLDAEFEYEEEIERLHFSL